MKRNYFSAVLAVLACSLQIDAGGNAPVAINTATQKGPNNAPGGGADIAKHLRRGLEKEGKAKKGANKAQKKTSKASKAKATKSPKGLPPTKYLNKLGTIKLDFNPAFLSFGNFNNSGSALFITSFFTVYVQVGQGPPAPVPLSPDLVAKIDMNKSASFDGDEMSQLEVLTDRDPNAPPGPPKTVWPNEAKIAPDGVFPFEALVISQGFWSAPFPGRISAIDLSTNSDGEEYIITQSVGLGEDSRIYHTTIYHDMDGDGFEDIISVRSNFRVFPVATSQRTGELVWFKNPGSNIEKDVEWKESVLVSGLGPDIYIIKSDFDQDGIPEFLTTHFFTGSKLTIYGVSGDDKDWSDVVSGNATIQSVDLGTDQGSPFGVQVADLDGDGQMAEILVTNHQNDNCEFEETIPGRVYALIPPVDKGMLFDSSKWDTKILLDDIYPQPSMPNVRSSRAAPGKAKTFYPSRKEEKSGGRPWIVVGGDEAGKVWVLRPLKQKGWEFDWIYESEVVFDINDTYGAETTQTYMTTKPFITVSTIGNVAVRYDRETDDGMAEIYIPVFEGQEIHVISFRKNYDDNGEPFLFTFPEDGRLECPAAP